MSIIKTHVSLNQAGNQPLIKNIGPSVLKPVLIILIKPSPGPEAD